MLNNKSLIPQSAAQFLIHALNLQIKLTLMHKNILEHGMNYIEQKQNNYNEKRINKTPDTIVKHKIEVLSFKKEDILTILSNDNLHLTETEKLVRPPKGYELDNPAIEFLKLKSFVATMEISDADVSNKNLVKKVITCFESMKPLVYFLNKAIFVYYCMKLDKVFFVHYCMKLNKVFFVYYCVKLNEVFVSILLNEIE